MEQLNSENVAIDCKDTKLSTKIFVSADVNRNGRRKLEDRYVIENNLNEAFDLEIPHKYKYYAIFDGHCNEQAAEYCKNNLHLNLISNDNFKQGNIREALKEVFLKTDNDFCDKISNESNKAGTTALVCLIEDDKHLYLAWAGDSTSILIKDGSPILLTKPHTPELESERERIKLQGGDCIYTNIWRVMGILAVSRSIGDPDYKPYVTAEPDIVDFELNGNEDFLILASDGLWDTLTPEDASTIVYEFLSLNAEEQNNSNIIEQVSKLLIKRSVEEGSSDNITTIVLFFKDLNKIAPSIKKQNGQNGHQNNVYVKINGNDLHAYENGNSINNLDNNLNGNGYPLNTIPYSPFNNISISGIDSVRHLQERALINNVTSNEDNQTEQQFELGTTNDNELNYNEDGDEPHSILPNINDELNKEEDHNQQQKLEEDDDDEDERLQRELDEERVVINDSAIDDSHFDEKEEDEEEEEEDLIKNNQETTTNTVINCEYSVIPTESTASPVDLMSESTTEDLTENKQVEEKIEKPTSPFINLEEEHEQEIRLQETQLEQLEEMQKEDNSFELISKDDLETNSIVDQNQTQFESPENSHFQEVSVYENANQIFDNSVLNKNVQLDDDENEHPFENDSEDSIKFFDKTATDQTLETNENNNKNDESNANDQTLNDLDDNNENQDELNKENVPEFIKPVTQPINLLDSTLIPNNLPNTIPPTINDDHEEQLDEHINENHFNDNENQPISDEQQTSNFEFIKHDEINTQLIMPNNESNSQLQECQTTEEFNKTNMIKEDMDISTQYNLESVINQKVPDLIDSQLTEEINGDVIEEPLKKDNELQPDYEEPHLKPEEIQSEEEEIKHEQQSEIQQQEEIKPEDIQSEEEEIKHEQQSEIKQQEEIKPEDIQTVEETEHEQQEIQLEEIKDEQEDEIHNEQQEIDNDQTREEEEEEKQKEDNLLIDEDESSNNLNNENINKIEDVNEFNKTEEIIVEESKDFVVLEAPSQQEQLEFNKTENELINDQISELKKEELNNVEVSINEEHKELEDQLLNKEEEIKNDLNNKPEIIDETTKKVVNNVAATAIASATVGAAAIALKKKPTTTSTSATKTTSKSLSNKSTPNSAKLTKDKIINKDSKSSLTKDTKPTLASRPTSNLTSRQAIKKPTTATSTLSNKTSNITARKPLSSSIGVNKTSTVTSSRPTTTASKSLTGSTKTTAPKPSTVNSKLNTGLSRASASSSTLRTSATSSRPATATLKPTVKSTINNKPSTATARTSTLNNKTTTTTTTANKPTGSTATSRPTINKYSNVTSRISSSSTGAKTTTTTNKTSSSNLVKEKSSTLLTKRPTTTSTLRTTAATTKPSLNSKLSNVQSKVSATSKTTTSRLNSKPATTRQPISKTTTSSTSSSAVANKKTAVPRKPINKQLNNNSPVNGKSITESSQDQQLNTNDNSINKVPTNLLNGGQQLTNGDSTSQNLNNNSINLGVTTSITSSKSRDKLTNSNSLKAELQQALQQELEAAMELESLPK